MKNSNTSQACFKSIMYFSLLFQVFSIILTLLTLITIFYNIFYAKINKTLMLLNFTYHLNQYCQICHTKRLLDVIIKLESFYQKEKGLKVGFTPQEIPTFRSSQRRCSVKKDVLKNYVNLTAKHLCWSLQQKETQTLVFSYEICEIVKNTYFKEQLRTTASKPIILLLVRIVFLCSDHFHPYCVQRNMPFKLDLSKKQKKRQYLELYQQYSSTQYAMKIMWMELKYSPNDSFK